MLVQEGLRQLKEGQVSTQGPAGPTLAMQMAQAAQQPQQPPQQPSMMPPPLGQEPEGDVANVAQNVGLGAAIQGQQQQQAQQAMMQMAQQQQQAQRQQPAMMASGGAGLAADNMRGFKEGGVLGFNERGSVPDPDETQKAEDKAKIDSLMSSIGKGIAGGAKRIGAAAYDVGTLIPRAALGAADTGIIRPLRAYGVPIPNISDKLFGFGEGRDSMTPMSDLLDKAKPERSERKSAAAKDVMPEAKKIEYETRGDPNVSEENKARLAFLRSQMDTRGTTGPAPTDIEIRPQASPAARPTGAANVPSPPAAPALDLPGLLAQARGATPEQSNVFLDKQAAAQEELNKLRAAQPAPNQVALQALLDAQQKRARLSEQDEAGAGGRGLAALFQGMMGRNEGSSVAAHNEREKQRRRLDIAETLADKEKESAIRDIQAAKAAGDKEKEAAGYKDLGLSKQKSQELQALREGQSIQAAYQLKSREMENASAEKLQLMRQRQENATKTMPTWEQTQIEADVKQLAGPGADIKKILAAREIVLSSRGKISGEAGAAAKDTATRAKTAADWAKEPANSGRLMAAMNSPEKLKALYKERDEYINALMGTPSGSTAKTPEQEESENIYLKGQ